MTVKTWVIRPGERDRHEIRPDRGPKLDAFLIELTELVGEPDGDVEPVDES